MIERYRAVVRRLASRGSRLGVIGFLAVVGVAAGSVLAVLSVEATRDSTTITGPRAKAHRAPPICQQPANRRGATNATTNREPVLAHGSYAPHGNLHVVPRERLVALSFDDGPSPLYTTAVLRDLREGHAHASFFVEGRFAAQFGGLLREEVAGGNEVSNHTYDHKALAGAAAGDRLRLSATAVRRELASTDDAICAAGLPRPLLFRPPYGRGVFNQDLAAIAGERGQRVIGWDVSIEHYLLRSRSLADDTQMILTRVHPGAILLGHDGASNRGHVLAVLPELLQRLHTLGYRVVTVEELLQSAA